MKSKIFFAVTGLAASLTLSAQGLHKEITVEREIVPVKREASRLNILPKLQLSPLARPNLAFSERVVTSAVPANITTLAPVAFGDRLYSSPYRGYVVLGAGAPLFDGVLSAGYRALDSKTTRLSVYGQYDGDVYTQKISAPHPDDSRKLYWRDHSASLAADFHHSFGKNSSIDAGAGYTYAYNNVPLWLSALGRNISRGEVSAAFSSKAEETFDYSIGLDYKHFGFYHLSGGDAREIFGAAMKPVRQNLLGIDLSGHAAFSENSSVTIDVSGDFLHTGKSLRPIYPYQTVANVTGETRGLISFTPHFDYKSSSFRARIGAQLDFGINNGKTIHLAPEVSMAWTPSQCFGLQLKAQGGSELNSLSTLYGDMPYISPFMSYDGAHIPVDAEARLTVGPFFGASLELVGGYAKANSWLMPTLAPKLQGGAVFESVDLSAFRFGAAFNYEYRRLLSLRLSYEGAPNDYGRSYFAWRDRARHVVGAELKLRPAKPLLITAGWEFRAGRRIYETVSEIVGDPQAEIPLVNHHVNAVGLGCVSSLGIGAGYSVNDRLTVFLRGENLLARHYYHIGFRYSQGPYGLIGASLKF